MRKDALAKASSTAQVRLLTLKLLSDGKIHKRKEIVGFVTKMSEEYGLKHFSQGCIAGGIQQAVTYPGCEKVDAATYQLKSPITDPEFIYMNGGESVFEAQEENLALKTVEIFENFSQQLISVSRTIDFVSADENQLKQLSVLRECIQKIDEWKSFFQQ